MQNQLHSTIYCSILTVLSFAFFLTLPGGASTADDDTASPDSSVFIAEWPAYARDPGGMRHSPLTQINRGNVRGLKVAWTFRTGELATYGPQFSVARVAFEATPIMVDRTLYFSTPTCRVFALDAATGQQRWLYDPKIDLDVYYVFPNSRGVSTWVDPTKRPGESGYRRIFVGTVDGRLIALDAATGQPCQTFGKGGSIDLTSGAEPYGGNPYPDNPLAPASGLECTV